MAARSPKPPPLGRIRFANIDDATTVLDLVNESVAKTFRAECANDIMYLIENGIISICQLNAYDNIVGFLSARDYPMIPSVHPSSWEGFIWSRYKSIELNARNTLFLHLLCWNPAYTRETVDNMLKSVFMHDPYIQHIAMVKSAVEYPQLVPGQSRSEASFRRVQAMERGVGGERLPALLIADRVEVSPRLRIRRAVEEDNDDLVPIIENHSERLQQLYGEFYISELISRHPESDRVLLVCEHKELAVGMMCLNTTVNYEALEESFVLSPFGGLRHLDNESAMCLSSDQTEQEVSSMSLFEPLLNEVLQKPDKEHTVIPSSHTPSISRETSEILEAINPHPVVMQLLLEDEESALEYDIVNIDTELLRVPEVLYSGLSRSPDVLSNMTDDKTAREKVKKKRKLEKPSRTSSLLTSRAPEPVRYKGRPNAFLIELFAMHPNYDERYGFDILEAAYELFPNRDYCILCLPSNQPPFPLLEHFTLVTPIGTRLSFINESLYVAHINSVRGNMRVRWGENYDIGSLRSVLENAPRMHALLNLYQTTLESKTIESFVFLSENQPVGMVVIGPLEDAIAVRTQYDLDPLPRRPGTDGAILAGILSPTLEPHARWFLREIMRQSRYSTLFWICRLFAKGDARPSQNLMSFAAQMNPVHPRQTVPNISGNKDLDAMYKHLAYPFALWMLERPLTSLPKVYVNNSIVVVGASRTGLAFIETLLMGPTSQYLTFSNVTLVSEHGLPTVPDCLKAADICVPRDGRFTDRYIKSIPFYFYVDVVSDIMVGIDRKRKCIHLKRGSTKYYDELVLTCGQQFQHPQYLEDALDLVKEVQKGKPCDRTLMDNPKYQEDRVPPPPELPSNVYLINSLFEANINLRKLMRNISEEKDESKALSESNQVVVYGDCIEAYSCISALLELGIQPKMIAFVEPFPSLSDPTAIRVNCFNNETVDERVQEEIEQLGIRVLRKSDFAGWKRVGHGIESLELMTPLHSITLKCFALFYFGMRAIDLHAFKAINECGLVYDGGLVVSPTFETNDPSIYGAGPCISYSRKLYATRRLHSNYCSEDIGEALAKLFLLRLDPFVMADPNLELAPSDLLSCTSSALGFKSQQSTGSSNTRMRNDPMNAFKRWQPVMKFKSPIAQSATLPGPLYYLKLRKSGREIPMAVQDILPHQGHTLITDKKGNYFRVQLNVLHVVDTVTCLSKKSFSTGLLSQLFGKHEAVFNKLLTRFMRNEIDDFYQFFTQPWMAALYQETFDDLMNEIHDQDIAAIYDLMKSKFALYDETGTRDVARSSLVRQSLASTISLIGLSERDVQRFGTFRAVIEKYIYARSPMADEASASEDIPSECGQAKHQHMNAKKFWERVSGERIVSAHIARYLDKNSITHPHYAMPKPECIID